MLQEILTECQLEYCIHCHNCATHISTSVYSTRLFLVSCSRSAEPGKRPRYLFLGGGSSTTVTQTVWTVSTVAAANTVTFSVKVNLVVDL